MCACMYACAYAWMHTAYHPQNDWEESAESLAFPRRPRVKVRGKTILMRGFSLAHRVQDD